MKRKSVLSLVITTLALSVFCRSLIHAEEAITRSQESTPASAAQASCYPDQPDVLIKALKQREEEVEKREQEIDHRISDMEAAEKRVRDQIAELKKAEEQLASTIAKARTASEDDIAKLTAVYEVMGAEGASKLFAEMEPNFAAGFIARMNSEAAASVLAGLKPEDAYAISLVLAGRNSNVPKN